MTLTLYNTLTRKKEPFRPIDPANVRMYVCGPTVYDFAHIGNARPVIVFDVLFRLLRHLAKQGVWDGGKGETRVTYARNITDVDDKINARAAEEHPDLSLNEAIARTTEKTTNQFHEDIRALGVLMPEDVNAPGEPPVFVEPRATEHIDDMRRLCEALVAKGHAYVAQDHVLFDVGSMPDYGRLANRSLEEMEAGARVEVAPYKKGPMDFVLWKPSKPGEPAWPSPKGIAAPGRPGWHLECSAMSDRWLWQEPQMKGLLSEAGLALPHVFDIHGGGIDLVFPHHENEIAQSRCGHGTERMANVWMHNGFLQVEGEKMSKSLGNFVTINELLKEWPGEVIRYQMLLTHYRQPIDWTASATRQARLEMIKFSRFLGRDGWEPTSEEIAPGVRAALEDDLNTPAAIAELHRLPEEFKTLADDQPLREMRLNWLVNSLSLLGFDRIHEFEQRLVQFRKVDQKLVDAMIDARNAARKIRDFAEADHIRRKLNDMGIQLKDAKDPATGEIVTTWEVKR